MMKNSEFILITGGTRGIGRAICKILAKEQYNIVFTYKSNEQMANELIKEIKDEFDIDSWGFKCDMSNPHEVKDFFLKYKQEFKRLDVLINNAGILGDNVPFIMTKDEDWWKVFNNNVASVVNTCRFAIPLMIVNKKGKILNITSLSGQKGNPGQSAYSASKASIVSFSKALNKEMGKFGIIINCISPGLIETDMTKNVSEEYFNASISRSPLKRMGTSEEVAELVKLLILAPPYLIGQEITIDGGIGG